jgi:Mg2+ and Co2+ transporter CorA
MQLQGPPITAMSSNTTNVVGVQPVAGLHPNNIQVVPRQANDHLWLTIALIFVCFMLGCNWLGALALIPGLICAAVVC